MLPLHCHVPPPFLSFIYLYIDVVLFIALYTQAHILFYLRWLIYAVVSVCFPPRYALTVVNFCRSSWCSPFFVSFLIRVYTRLHVWMSNTTTRASIPILFLLLFSSCLLNFLFLIFSFLLQSQRSFLNIAHLA